MYALVDGNNFYVSCERIFRPSLNDKPVVVLVYATGETNATVYDRLECLAGCEVLMGTGASSLRVWVKVT